MCQWFAGELISGSNQESVDQFVVKFGVRRWSQPWGEENCVPILDKVTMCTTNQPIPLPYPCSNPISSSPTFLPHALVHQNIQNSEKCPFTKGAKIFNFAAQNTMCACAASFSRFGENFILAVDPVHCWLPPVQIHSELFHTFSKCYSIPVFTVLPISFFPKYQNW